MALAVSESRLAAIVEGWGAAKASNLPGTSNTNSFVVVVGAITPATQQNQRGFALVQFAFASNEPVAEVAVVVTSAKILIVSPRDAASVTVPAAAGGLTVEYVKVTTGDDASFASVASALPSGEPIGYAEKEWPLQEGNFASSVIAALKGASLQLVDASAAIGYSIASLDAPAHICMKKAVALGAAALRKYIIPELQSQLTGTPTTCRQFSLEVLARLQKPSLLPGLESMDNTNFEPSFQPVLVQCGDHYDIRAVTNEEPKDHLMSPDCVVVAFGVKHCGYSAYIARSIMIDSGAPKNIRDLYDFVLAVSDRIIALLKPGVTFASVYDGAMETAKSLSAELAGYLTPSLGFAGGLQVALGPTSISKAGIAKVRPNMVVVVRVALANVPHANAAAGSNRTVSVLLGDTIFINESEAVNMTPGRRATEEVHFHEEVETTIETVQRDLAAITRAGRGGVDRISKEDQRQQKQAKIIADKHAEWKARGGQPATLTDGDEFKVFELGRLAKGDVRSYAAHDPSMPNVAPTAFEVDRAKNTMWLPIHGTATPFHISTVNRIEVKSDATGHYLIVAFFNTTETNLAFKANRAKIFIKDVSYFAKNAAKFDRFVVAVKEVKAKLAEQDQQRKQRQGLAAAGKLTILSNGPRLKVVKIRPPPATGRNAPSSGDLEAHANGFRFQCVGMEPISIMYENIKHAIFQPSDNDICVTFHVTLKDPIMIGKKKTNEVQFVAEVIESSEGLAAARRTHEQELEAEALERERIKKTNGAFFAFARDAEKHMGGVKVQVPMKTFEFQGCHSRALTRFKGNEQVLWAINDMPFFSVSLADVELVSLERVIPSGGNFDLVLVPPYPYKAVTTITTIPMSSIDVIKDWLNSANVVYMESGANMAWTTLLKAIREDPEWEPWGEEGWRTQILPDDSDEEDESDDESWDSDEEEESEDDDSDESGSDWAEEVSEDDDSDVSDVSDDSSVLSWDEMEARAEADDRKRNDSDSDDDKIRKKKTRK